MNAGLAVAGECAYVGGRAAGLPVLVLDIADPTAPQVVRALPAIAGSTARELRAAGDLGLLVVLQYRLAGGSNSLTLYDIRDCRRPVRTGTYDFGPLQPHEFFLWRDPQQPGRVLAYVATFAAAPGLVVVDLSQPATPRWLGRFEEPRAAEGNTHSVSLAHGGALALVADETARPPWGRLRLVDVQDPANPVQVGTFETEDSAANRRAPAEYGYSIHNPLADDRNPNRAYLAWYADGVRLVDISDASNPVEIGSWLPSHDPMVWNVFLMGNLLLVGDVNNGLFVLSR
jgi:hypothetical protein